MDGVKQLNELINKDKIVKAIVCNLNFYNYLRLTVPNDNFDLYNPTVNIPIFEGIDIFIHATQKENYRVFSDNKELIEYLTSNLPKK